MGMQMNALRLAQAIDKAPELLRRNMGKAIRRITAIIARSAKRHAPKAFSNLVNSINDRQLSDFEGIVYAGINYARAIEEGTGIQGPRGVPSGKRPPIAPLEDWVRLRGLTPKHKGDSPRDVAYAIARSIALKGTKAQPFMGPALEENNEASGRRADAAIDATLAAI